MNHISKLQSMYKDLQVSLDLMKVYNKKNQDTTGVQFSIEILSQGVWPEQEQVPLILPRLLGDIAVSYQEFYTSKHKGKSLKWLYGHSTV